MKINQAKVDVLMKIMNDTFYETLNDTPYNTRSNIILAENRMLDFYKASNDLRDYLFPTPQGDSQD